MGRAWLQALGGGGVQLDAPGRGVVGSGQGELDVVGRGVDEDEEGIVHQALAALIRLGNRSAVEEDGHGAGVPGTPVSIGHALARGAQPGDLAQR